MEQKKIELKVIGVSPNIKLTCGYGLYLQEKQGKRRGLLLIIGGAEAQAVSYAQKGLAAPRPFTHDLFFTCFSAFGVLLKEVFIYKSVDGVYYSYLYFERDGEQHCFDARTSDAIALALRFKAPIFVDAGILAREHMELGDENPSITFPMSALALHFEYSPNEEWKLKESLYNGVSSDAFNRQFRFCPVSDGVLNIGSVSYLPDDEDESFSLYELGYMLDSGGNRGGVRSSYWANVEQYVATIGEAQLSVMAQGGWHPGSEVECRGYVSGAVLATGVSKMDLSVGLSANRIFCPLGIDETDVELSVICPVWKYLSLQPAVHCIVADGSCDVVGLLRVTFEICN